MCEIPGYASNFLLGAAGKLLILNGALGFAAKLCFYMSSSTD
jgi:hypothetical protein